MHATTGDCSLAHGQRLRALGEMASGIAHPARASAPASRRHIRILVVDDEKQLAHMASVALTQHGHAVVVAPTGEAALEVLEHQRFELIVSDPGVGSGKNGWDLAQAVRARWPEMRFVLVTDWGAGIDLKDARARGVHEVISKPYRITDLRQVAERPVGARDAE